jgi:heme-degrading monooxygenase HmoA
MHARVNYRQIPPGEMDEAVRTYREVTGPDRRAQPGFQQGLILTNRDTGKMVIISRWGSEDDSQAAGRSRLAELINSPPCARQAYEISTRV